MIDWLIDKAQRQSSSNEMKRFQIKLLTRKMLF